MFLLICIKLSVFRLLWDRISISVVWSEIGKKFFSGLKKRQDSVWRPGRYTPPKTPSERGGQGIFTLELDMKQAVDYCTLMFCIPVVPRPPRCRPPSRVFDAPFQYTPEERLRKWCRHGNRQTRHPPWTSCCFENIKIKLSTLLQVLMSREGRQGEQSAPTHFPLQRTKGSTWKVQNRLKMWILQNFTTKCTPRKKSVCESNAICIVFYQHKHRVNRNKTNIYFVADKKGLPQM